MTRRELDILSRLLVTKEQKTQFINSQDYIHAAYTRDSERDVEKELVAVIKEYYPEYSNQWLMVTTSSDHEILSNYFIRNFGFEYPTKIDDGFRTSILRELKLKELGI